MKTIMALRKERKLSRRQVAETLGVASATTIQNWELGVSEPNARHWLALAILFGVRCDEMSLPERRQPKDTPI